MTISKTAKGLLPPGLGDVLPPDAGQRAALGECLLAWVAAHGFERVETPLLDFVENLRGVELEWRAFRLNDPLSGRLLALRTDITPQIGRIATSRLADAPRPLRLSYGGTVIRVKGAQVNPERQFTQIGAELIGAATTASDVEMIRLAVMGLARLGILEITCDFTLPRLVPEVLAHFGTELDAEERQAIRTALRHKDVGEITELLGEAAPPLARLLTEFIAASGPLADAMAALDARLSEFASLLEPHFQPLRQIVPILAELCPALCLTLDLVEERSFDYNSALQFNFYADGVQGEVLSGGRYFIGQHSEQKGEAAIGITWYLEKIWPLLPKQVTENRVYMPPKTPWAIHQTLQDQGFVTINGLPPGEGDDAAQAAIKEAIKEAGRLRCQFIYADGKLQPLPATDFKQTRETRKK